MERYHPAHQKSNKDMEHSFNTGLAKIVGVEGAVILKHLFYWVQKNYGNNKHFYDGSYWTYNSVRGFSVIFDYLSIKQINRILNNLIDGGYIKTGNYNSNKMDRTMWYAFTEKGIELMEKNGLKLDGTTDLPKSENAIEQNKQMDLPKSENGFSQKGECNTNIVTNIITDDILTNVSSADTTTNEPKPTQAEKKKSSSAKQQKKDMVLDSNNRLAAAADPASRYGRFMQWAVQTIPDCYSTMAMPTENQLMMLINTYGNSAVIDIFETIENRQDIRGKYKSLYLTAKNWLKRDEMKKQ